MQGDYFELRQQTQELLGKDVVDFQFKGKGCANEAYYARTNDGAEYLIKKERDVIDLPEENDLIVEANVIRKLNQSDPALPIPHIIIISDVPKLFAYKYIAGELMIHTWNKLSEEQRIELCQNLGEFHSKIAKHINKEEAKKLGINIYESPGLSETEEKNFKNFISNTKLPESLRAQAQHSRFIFDETASDVIFHFIHNDAHNENIIISNGKLASIIDFGDCEYNDIHKDFCFYIRFYPEYLEYFVKGYENASGRKLSRKRLISYAMLKDLNEIENCLHGTESEVSESTQAPDNIPAKNRAHNYNKLLEKYKAE